MKQLVALLGAFLLLTIGSCSKSEGEVQEPILPEITLSKDSHIVSKAGATLSVNVGVTTPDGKWTYTVSSAGKDWCKPSRKANSNTLKIEVTPNNSDKMRETSVSIIAESDNTLRKSIKIKQASAADGIIVEEGKYEVPSRNHTFSLPFFANVEFEVTIEQGVDWIEYIPRSEDAAEDEPLSFKITNNPNSEEREATITITSAEPKETATITIKQRSRDSVANADAIPDDEVVPIHLMTTSSPTAYGGLGTLKNAYDGDLKTWFGATGELPIEFRCQFQDAARIDYMDIHPGQNEGVWDEIDIYGTEEGGEQKHIGTYSLNFSTEVQRLYFTLVKPKEVIITVRTAKDTPITAAMHEIVFYSKGGADFDALKYFTDLSCAELRDDVTEEQIEAIPNAFFRDLAAYIYSGDYDTKYRAAYYKPYPHPDVDAKLFRTTGYTLLDNITGMYFEEGEHVVFVDDTHDIPVSISVVDYNRNDSGDTYILYKGLNKLNITHKGLIYVRYHSEDPTAQPIRVNFPTAVVNGYYDIIEDPEADVTSMLENACCDMFDMRGARAIYTFPVADYKQYCGNTKKAFDIMQQADSIIFLQEQFQGHHKYNTGGHRNRMLYVASPNTAFMYASGYLTGYSINPMHGGAAMRTMLDPCQLRWNAWGPYHEVGHKNQIPGFNWAGMGEVSNNICAMYCVMKFRGWSQSDYIFTEGNEKIKDENGNVLRTHNDRYEAAWAELAGYGENPYVYSLYSDPFYKLVPLWQLYLYNTKVMGREDFYPDLYNVMRTSNDIPEDNGARQLNFVKVCCDVAKEDLTEFFEKWGFFVICDEVIDDYGNKRLIVTEEMVQAIKDHAAQYPKPEKKNLWFLSNYNLQKFIDTDGSGVTGYDTPRLN